jgi:RHH-type proline utilization regulon transcriptional repressor/proline dehydrogenase/delta 1-pyrroline-5-carboxylate dehydrogenase
MSPTLPARGCWPQNVDVIYPQFATHNAHTVAYVASIMSAAGPERFEFQRLHGMGEELYAAGHR